MNKRRLGRGLDSLLGTEEGGFEASSLESADLQQLPVDRIDPNPYQPRRHFDAAEIATLADSIRQHGILQPVIVRAVGDRYQLIAGERRLRASVEARMHQIPARVMVLDDRKVTELAMVENLQREDLNALEKANAFRDYLKSYGGTQEDLAKRLGVDRSTLSNLLRLLDLPEEVQAAVMTGAITQGHARALLGLPDPEAMVLACRQVIADALSVRQTEALVSTGVATPSRPRVRKDPAEANSTAKAPHFVELEEHLRNRFGTAVLVRPKAKERGQIVIDFNSQEEYDRVVGPDSWLLRDHRCGRRDLDPRRPPWGRRIPLFDRPPLRLGTDRTRVNSSRISRTPSPSPIFPNPCRISRGITIAIGPDVRCDHRPLDASGASSEAESSSSLPLPRPLHSSSATKGPGAN